MTTIRLNKKDKTIRVVDKQTNFSIGGKKDNKIKVVNRPNSIRIKREGNRNTSLTRGSTNAKIGRTSTSVNVRRTGERGPQGHAGIDGEGVPSGGLPGQALVKFTEKDFDTLWTTPTGEDKTFIHNFSVSDEVEVEHNLAKYPSVTVHDSAGDEVVGTVIHININKLKVSFSAPFSGLVTCN